MPQTLFTTEDLNRAFRLPFQDPEWLQKLTIASLLSLVSMFIPVLPMIFLMGYITRYAESVLNGDDTPQLPSWTDLKDLLIKGLRYLGAKSIVGLPTLIVFPAMFLLIAVFTDSYWTLGEDQAMPVIVLAWLMFMMITGVVTIYAGLLGFLMPAGIMHMISKRRFLSAFALPEWLPILRANLSGFFLTALVYFGVMYVASYAIQILAITIVLLILVPIIFAMVYGYMLLVSDYLFALAYRRGTQT